MHRFLAKAVGPVLGRVPLSLWPRSVSRITGVLTPQAILPHPTPSASGGANIRMLVEFLDRTAAVQGDVAECGVWRGRTLIAMALYLKQRHSSKILWGFDSFKGFDHATPHNFKNASASLVEEKVGIFRLANVNIVPGYFRESLHTVADRNFSFVHLDCDIYESYKECLAFFYPRLSSKGVILFDEYNDPDWPGANRAVNEFCEPRGIPIHCSTVDNFSKSFIVAA
jgi:O-methyltransferase